MTLPRESGLALVCLLCIVSLTPAQDPGAEETPFPTWQQVERRIAEHFTKLAETTGYRGGDFLSRRSVEPLMGALDRAGWKVKDKDAILAQITPDDDLLSRQFSTRQGREFMRKVAGNPENFSHMHRLAQTANGTRQIQDLMKLPNGPDVLAALVSSPQGHDISRRIAAGPRTRNFNKPTGRIYVQSQLVARLRESYTQEVADRAKAEAEAIRKAVDEAKR